jgi:hypothetical protein
MTAHRNGAKPKTTAKDSPQMVNVRVAVNHENFRRGEAGEVELTETVRRRLDAGYLTLVDDGSAPLAPLGSVAARPSPGSLLGVTSSNPTPPAEETADGQGASQGQD